MLWWIFHWRGRWGHLRITLHIVLLPSFHLLLLFLNFRYMQNYLRVHSNLLHHHILFLFTTIKVLIFCRLFLHLSIFTIHIIICRVSTLWPLMLHIRVILFHLSSPWSMWTVPIFQHVIIIPRYFFVSLLFLLLFFLTSYSIKRSWSEISVTDLLSNIL